MCPLWPIHILLFYVLLLGPLWMALGAAAQAMSSCDVTFSPDPVTEIVAGNYTTVEITLNKTEISEQAKTVGINGSVALVFFTDDTYYADVSPEHIPLEDAVPSGDDNGMSKLKVNVTGSVLGYTQLCMYAVGDSNRSEVVKCVPVSVIRESSIGDKVFTFSVAFLVAVIYVNMGAALDIRTVKDTIVRPIGPAIGFVTQFLIMPLLSFAIAKLIIPDPALQLGLFITGCSPGGGASNIWTLTLGGNLDLSITMTTISTFSAFAMMPFWIFTLGSTIFAEAKLAIPYFKIGTFAISLVIPLLMGITIQVKWPSTANFLVKILKPFALFLIVFIVIFAVYTNLYLFSLLTWPVLLSGMLLPWLGYLLGGGTAWLLRQDWKDVLAIGIETGVQNTGLAILALRYSLGQPAGDLNTVLPVTVAMFTPIVPGCIMLYQKLFGMPEKKEAKKEALVVVPINELSPAPASNLNNGTDNKAFGSSEEDTSGSSTELTEIKERDQEQKTEETTTTVLDN